MVGVGYFYATFVEVLSLKVSVIVWSYEKAPRYVALVWVVPTPYMILTVG